MAAELPWRDVPQPPSTGNIAPLVLKERAPAKEEGRLHNALGGSLYQEGSLRRKESSTTRRVSGVTRAQWAMR